MRALTQRIEAGWECGPVQGFWPGCEPAKGADVVRLLRQPVGVAVWKFRRQLPGLAGSYRAAYSAPTRCGAVWAVVGWRRPARGASPPQPA